jgi:hypothetical protein
MWRLANIVKANTCLTDILPAPITGRFARKQDAGAHFSGSPGGPALKRVCHDHGACRRATLFALMEGPSTVNRYGACFRVSAMNGRDPPRAGKDHPKFPISHRASLDRQYPRQSNSMLPTADEAARRRASARQVPGARGWPG